MAPTLAGEAVAEDGAGGAMLMEGAAGTPPIPQQNASSHGPPRTSPTGNPVLPLAQPPIGQQFQAYRGIMPPFVRFVTFSFWHICRECLKLQCIHSRGVTRSRITRLKRDEISRRGEKLSRREL